MQWLMSVWQPASNQAQGITALSWWMFGVATAVLIAVMVLLVVAVRRARRLGAESPLSSRQRTWVVIAGGVALPFVAAVALLAASVPLGSASAPATAPADALLIEVTGHRWWWEVHYLDAREQRIATTANEIHVPVGRAVKVRLKSEDVIHSFWAPNVQGKADLVPGRTNELWFRVDREGTWRGQCAEFCGTQHAMMGFFLIGQPPDQFEAWLTRQAAPAAEPADELARQGRAVFETSSCVLCHSVRGTIAGGRVAPDLTHVGSRRTLAGARLPNGRGSLAAWITDPQKVKPGSRMPATPLSGDELHALLHYLEGLE